MSAMPEPGLTEAQYPGEKGPIASARAVFQDELSQYSRLDRELGLRLPQVCDKAPDDTMVHVGRILEALLRDYWIHSPDISGQPSQKVPLDKLIQQTLSADKLEKIRCHAEILQKMRNLAAHLHAALVDEGDAADAVRRLLIILRWFADERAARDRAAGGRPVVADGMSPPGEGSQPGQRAGPGGGHLADWWEDHPPLWELESDGPWACLDLRGRPAVVQADGKTLLISDWRPALGWRSSAVSGPWHAPVTDLTVTTDGCSLVVVAGHTLCWADHDPADRAPLRWVTARRAVPGAKLLAGARRKNGVNLVIADPDETFRLRIDSRGEADRAAVAPTARSAAAVGPWPGLVLVDQQGTLNLLDGAAGILPPLPDDGWVDVDAANIGPAVVFAGLRYTDGDAQLCLGCQGRLSVTRLPDRSQAVRVSRGHTADRLGPAIVVRSGRVLQAWPRDALTAAPAVATAPEPSAGSG